MQVRNIATFVLWLDRAATEATTLAEATDNMLAAYINEFGGELLETLTASEVIEAEVVESETDSSGGEIIDDEVEDDAQPSSEEAGLDASEEE